MMQFEGARPALGDAYVLILEAIKVGIYMPCSRLDEIELAERFGVSRTPVRAALQRVQTQNLLTRVGPSLIVASLDHYQMAELYVVRTELEGLTTRLAAQHALHEEVKVLQQMVDGDRSSENDANALSSTNRRFHKQLHLASHNLFLVGQLDLVYRSMVLLATTSLAVAGRGLVALDEHQAILTTNKEKDGEAAYAVVKVHLSQAFVTHLKHDETH